MTNTIFFEVLRDDESLSSSSSSRLSERDFSMVKSLPRYSALGKAFSALRKKIGPSNGTTQTRHIGETGTTNNDDEHVDFSHLSNEQVLESSSLGSISFTQLRIATKNFGRAYVLGDADTIRPVFKIWIDNHKLTATEPGKGTALVVKRFAQNEFYGNKTKWLEYTNYFSQVYHPNLVKLVGYCLEHEHRLLVSEFMPEGSLEDHLFNTHPDVQPLSLSNCMKVAYGAAKGLAFLHNTGRIHGDFKPSNILVDSNYNAKLSDFGFAKEASGGRYVEAIYGDVTLGHDYLNEYTAPESLRTGYLDEKSDIYSFGLVFLEMLLNQRIVQKNQLLGTQFRNVHKAMTSDSELDRILGPHSQAWNKHWLLSIIEKQSGRLLSLTVFDLGILIASICLSEQISARPRIDIVVEVLEKYVMSGMLDANRKLRG